MQVKEGQKKRTEGEQGLAEFKRLTLQGRNNKTRQFRNSGTMQVKEDQRKREKNEQGKRDKIKSMRNRVKVQKGRTLKGSIKT